MNEVWHARSGIVARPPVESGPDGEDLAAGTPSSAWKLA